MKTLIKKTSANLFNALATVALLALSTPTAFSANGNWNVDAAGNWSTAGNWSSNPTVPGAAAGDVVGLNFNISAARIVTLDTAATVGTLNLGDPTTSFFGYTLSGSSTLTFDNNGGGAQLVQAISGGAADTISVPITLNDSLTVTNVNGLTLSGDIGGSGGIVKKGAGTLALNNGASTFSGGFTNAGPVTYGAGSSGGAGSVSSGPFGTGTITLTGGSLFTTSGSGQINNNVYVASGTTVFGNNGGGGNPAFGGPLTGTGTIANSTTGSATSPLFSGDLSGFQGAFNITNYSTSNARFGTSSTASQIINASQASFVLTLGSGSTRNLAISDGSGGSTLRMGSLSGNGVINGSFNNSAQATCTYEIGSLNTSTIFSGRLSDATSGHQADFNVVKVGAGTLTLSGNNSLFTGALILSNGIVKIGNSNTSASAGPLGAGSIMFAGGTLQYSATNAFSDYSARIASSTGPISIDVNGTNVTFAAALAANNTGGLMLTNSTGVSKLTLTAANLYTGPTVINAGTLALTGNGTVASSSTVTVGSGAAYDLSGVTSTPHALTVGQSLLGSGVVTGAVTTASTSGIYGGTDGAAGTLSFSNALTMTAGSTFNTDVNTTTNSGNDLVKVAGTLTLNSTAFNVRALNGATALQTTNYILVTAGGLVGTPNPAVNWIGTQPANAANFTIVTNGNSIVLKYSTTSSATVVVEVNPTNGVHGSSFKVTATVTKGTGTITNVVADLGGLAGSTNATLVLSNTVGLVSVYTNTFTVPAAAPVGADSVVVRAKDTTPLTGIGSTIFTVNSSTLTWNGSGANDNWNTGLNWDATIPPGLVGDTLVFSGNTRLTPNMNNSYSVMGIAFDGSAGSFLIGSSTGGVLTMSSNGVINSSGNLQTMDVPVTLTAPQTFDAGGSGLTFGKAITNGGNLVTVQGSGVTTVSNTISGVGGVTMKGDLATGGVLLLLGTNTYAGDTTIVPGGGTIRLGNSQAIPNGVGKGNVVLGALTTLDLNNQNASINGLSGFGTVDNGDGGAASLTVGNGDVALTFGGVIQNSSGTVTLVKAGTNVFTISTAYSHSGGTVLSNGSIVYQNAGAFGSGTLTLAGGNLVKAGGAVTVANAVNVTGAVDFAGTSGGNPEFTGALTGSGTLAVSNVPVGGITVQATSLILSGDLSGFTGTLSHTTTGGSPNGGNRLRLSGGSLGSVTINCAGARLMTFGSTSAGNPVDLGDDTYGTVQIGELSGPGGFIRGGWATAGNTTFEVGALNTSATYSGSIQNNPNGSFGLSGVTKVGTGTLTLNGPNSYSGPTIVSNGTLNVYSTKTGAGAFTVSDGATLGVTSVSAGSLSVSSLTLGSGAGCTNNFNGVSSTSSVMVTNAGALTLNGTVVVNIQGVLSVGQYPLIGSAGGITGTGGFVLGSIPPGTGANIGTNGNTIVLNVTTAPAAQLWTGSVNTNWNFATTNWSLGGNPGLYSDSLSATFDDTSSRTNVNLATNVAPVTLVVTNSTKNYTFSGANSSKITGSAAVTKSGNGTLTLLGLNNDFNGGFAINSGTVAIDGDGNLGGGTIDLQGTLTPVQNMTITKAIAVGPVSGSGSGTISVGPGLTLSNNTAMVNFGSGSGTLVKSGSGTLQLGALNSYSGGTVVSNGTLVLSLPGAPTGVGAVRGTLTIQQGATVNLTSADALGYNNDATRVGAVNINGGSLNNQTNGNQGYRTTINLTGGTLASPGGGSYNFSVGNGISSLASSTASSITAPIVVRDTATMPFDVALGTVPGGIDLTVSGVIGQQFAGAGLLKNGAGKMVLSETNTYTGTTTVNNGTLLVNGSISTGAVNVNGGAFGGTGTVNGPVTVNAGGTLSPGASIGTLTLNGNLTLSGYTAIELNRSLSPAQSNDVVNVAGALAYGGTLTVTNLGPALAAGNSFRVFPTGGTGSLTVSGDAGSGLAFSFSDGLLSVVTAGSSAHLTNSFSGNVLTLSWPAGWSLQVQTNSISVGLSTNWSVLVPSGAGVSTTNISINPNNPTVFYRLANP